MLCVVKGRPSSVMYFLQFIDRVAMCSCICLEYPLLAIATYHINIYR